MSEQEPKERILENAKLAISEALAKPTIDVIEFEAVISAIKDTFAVWYPDEAQRQKTLADLEARSNALKSGLATARSVAQTGQIQKLLKTGLKNYLETLNRIK